MTNPRTILRLLARTLLVAGAALLLNMPADAGKAARTRSSSAAPSGSRTQVSGHATYSRTRYGGHHHRSYGYGHYGYYGHRYYPSYYGYGYGFWPRVYVQGYYGYPVYYPYGPRPSAERQPYGGLDLDVRPRTTEIYVNGEYVGLARNFDGWPDVLWLEAGDYDVSFYRDGYETITRRLTVSDEAVIEVRERLKKGESVRPEPPAAQTATVAPVQGDAAPAPQERTDAPAAVVTYPRRSAGEDR